MTAEEKALVCQISDEIADSWLPLKSWSAHLPYLYFIAIGVAIGLCKGWI